jgi:arabinose-5-phosphate isomerase
MQPKPSNSELEKIGKAVFSQASQALQIAQGRIDQNFVEAVLTLFEHTGKVVITGIGKSGIIGKKIASTFCSTGIPTVFMHANEALHGDLGIYHAGDPTILISKSGATAELLRLIPLLKQLQSPLIALLGNVHSPIAQLSDIVLDASVAQEADPLGLVPTTSSLAALAFGDALACALIHLRQFNSEDFAKFHPAGQLGRNLLLKVSDVMHDSSKIACVRRHTPFRNILIDMTRKPYGAACVIDEQNRLIGLITDGDIRRALQEQVEISALDAQAIMTQSPVSVSPEASIGEAIRLMEDRPEFNQLSELPVIDSNSRILKGLIRIHDAYQPHSL